MKSNKAPVVPPWCSYIYHYPVDRSPFPRNKHWSATFKLNVAVGWEKKKKKKKMEGRKKEKTTFWHSNMSHRRRTVWNSPFWTQTEAGARRRLTKASHGLNVCYSVCLCAREYTKRYKPIPEGWKLGSRFKTAGWDTWVDWSFYFSRPFRHSSSFFFLAPFWWNLGTRFGCIPSLAKQLDVRFLRGMRSRWSFWSTPSLSPGPISFFLYFELERSGSGVLCADVGLIKRDQRAFKKINRAPNA